MVKNIKKLAVIPARGGSKSIPYKNIALVNNKPLIYWTIQQAINSKRFDYIHVSTDDVNIAEVAIDSGAKCDFLRPSIISGDSIGTNESITQTIHELQSRGHIFDIVAELQPTYCFRSSNLIQKTIDNFTNFYESSDSLITCTKIENTSHPDYCFKINDDMTIEFGRHSLNSFARQLLTPFYSCCGVVMLSKVNSFLNHNSFFSDRCLPYIIEDQINAFDINTQLDLDIANMISINSQNLLF